MDRQIAQAERNEIMFEVFNNSYIEIDEKTYRCDSQPDDKGRGSKVRRIFFEPNFAMTEGILVKHNKQTYIVVEANNWDDYCEMYIQKI
jgi:hypothetical protein